MSLRQRNIQSAKIMTSSNFLFLHINPKRFSRSRKVSERYLGPTFSRFKVYILCLKLHVSQSNSVSSPALPASAHMALPTSAGSKPSAHLPSSKTRSSPDATILPYYCKKSIQHRLPNSTRIRFAPPEFSPLCVSKQDPRPFLLAFSLGPNGIQGLLLST